MDDVVRRPDWFSTPGDSLLAAMRRRGLTTTVDDFVTGTSSDLSLSGLAAGASGGVQFFVSPSLALDGGVSLGVGKMGNVKVDGQKEDWGTPDNTTTTRLRFGANWYP